MSEFINAALLALVVLFIVAVGVVVVRRKRAAQDVAETLPPVDGEAEGPAGPPPAGEVR